MLLKGDEGVQNLGGWPKMAIFARGVITCRFRILDSSVPMVQPAKDQMRNNVSGPLDWARVGRVLPERTVSSPVIIVNRRHISQEFFEAPLLLTQSNHTSTPASSTPS